MSRGPPAVCPVPVTPNAKSIGPRNRGCQVDAGRSDVPGLKHQPRAGSRVTLMESSTRDWGFCQEEPSELSEARSSDGRVGDLRNPGQVHRAGAGGSGEGRCRLPVCPTCDPCTGARALPPGCPVTQCKHDFLLNSREASFATCVDFALRTPESHIAVTCSASAPGQVVSRRALGGGTRPWGAGACRGVVAGHGYRGTPEQRLPLSHGGDLPWA